MRPWIYYCDNGNVITVSIQLDYAKILHNWNKPEGVWFSVINFVNDM